MKIPFLNLKQLNAPLQHEINKAVERVMEQGFYIGGREVADFESQFAHYTGVPHCIGVGNATDALEIMLRGMGIGPGDEVLVPAFTWISDAEVVNMVGAKPVFIDILPDTYTIDPEKIPEKITPRTKAIIAVHLYGHPAKMDELMSLAAHYHLKVIEDCAQAHGAMYKGRKVGGIGHGAAFSFYPTKNLGALGDAGAITTEDGAFAQQCRLMANHGQPERDLHELIGRNSRLDTLQAAILKVKLPYLESWNGRRTEHALHYNRQLAHLDIQLPHIAEEAQHVFHIYPILSPQRDKLRAELEKKGVGTAVHYPCALPFTPAYAHYQHTPSDFPMAFRTSQQQLSLPISPALTGEEIEWAAHSLLSCP